MKQKLNRHARLLFAAFIRRIGWHFFAIGWSLYQKSLGITRRANTLKALPISYPQSSPAFHRSKWDDAQ